MLILAAVAINLTIGNNGIFTRAEDATIKYEIANEKEIVQRAGMAAILADDDRIIKKSNLEIELANEVGEGKTEVSDVGEQFEILFKDSNRYYLIDKNGNVVDGEEPIIDANPGDITKGQDGESLDGSESKPYEIYSVEDLVKFSQMTNEGNDFSNKYVKLENNLNLKSTHSYADYTNTTLFGDYNLDGTTEGIKDELNKEDEIGFVPINKFNGVFVGNNLKISNIYINESAEKNELIRGFIRENTGKIKDFTLAGLLNLNVRGIGKYDVGGISGVNKGVIENVKNQVNILGNPDNNEGWFFAGGIAGKNEGVIESCVNDGHINIGGNSDNRIGGIVGWMLETGNVKNCINNAYIKVETTNCACIDGIIEDSSGGIVENCVNNGKLEAIGAVRVYSGGIVSSPFETTINKCYNQGEIIGNGYAPRIGGIAGSPSNNTIITNCYNKGKIKTTDNSSIIRVGGILGDTMKGEITVKNSYNIGILEINGQASAKGLIYGTLKGSMDNCYYIEQEGFNIGNTSTAEITNCGPKSLDEMKKEEFVNLLNKETVAFKKDTNNINNGFPILEWQ